MKKETSLISRVQIHGTVHHPPTVLGQTPDPGKHCSMPSRRSGWQMSTHQIFSKKIFRTQRPANPGPEDRASLQLLQGTYFLEQTLKLNRVQDSYLDISAYNGAFVTISGGKELNSGWEQDGSVRSTTFEGEKLFCKGDISDICHLR